MDGAVHTLSQRLRQLTDISLGVVSVQAFGEAARHTACFPPAPHIALGAGEVAAAAEDLPRCVQPVHVQVCTPARSDCHAHARSPLGVPLLAQWFSCQA